MAHQVKEMKFLATPEKGEVSALLIRPGDATHLLVLGHGASTNMRHATLQTIAERMADALADADLLEELADSRKQIGRGPAPLPAPLLESLLPDVERRSIRVPAEKLDRLLHFHERHPVRPLRHRWYPPCKHAADFALALALSAAQLQSLLPD